MRILLTGAGGRLGRRVRRVLAHHPDVELTNAVSPRTASLGPDEITLELGDERSIYEVIRSSRPDAVLHLAGLVGGACEKDAEATSRINVDATAILARAAAEQGTTRFAFASTSAIYGDKGMVPSRETDEVNPTSKYGQSKLLAEAELRAAASDHPGFAATALRIFNIYGPGFDDSLVSRLLTSSPSDPVPLRGLDEFVRDYIHSDDVVDALFAAIRQPAESAFTVINVGSGEGTSNRDLIAQVALVVEPHVAIGTGPWSYSCADAERAHRLLGLSARRLDARSLASDDGELV